MIIFVDGHKFHYETENLCRVFFPFENIKVLRENCEWQVYTGEKIEKGEYTITVSLKFEDYNKTLTASLPGNAPDDERELKMATLLYTLLTEYTEMIERNECRYPPILIHHSYIFDLQSDFFMLFYSY